MADLCSEPNNGLLTLSQALEKIHHAINSLNSSETVPLKQALGRTLAKDLHSAINIPAFRNASMDGYALAIDGQNQNTPIQLTIAGTSWAGTPYNKPCLPGQCIRIFTGAIVPEGANCVIMQEHVLREGDKAIFNAPFVNGNNIRSPGDDVAQGDQILAAGKEISATDLGLIAAAGIYKVTVQRKLRIAYFSTGNELTALGTQLQAGQIYDSNRYTLAGLLDNHRHEVSDLGVLIDDKEHIKNTLLKCAQQYDVIITTGGASVGEADYIQQILQEIGHVDFWKIAMKPGKPLAFGKIHNSYFFGLPGNPVSVIATYQQVVLPTLKQLAGLQSIPPLRIKAKSNSDLKKAAGRQEFQRGILQQLDDGSMVVESAGKQGSHILSAISQANCYIVLAANCTGIKKDQWVEVELFSNFK